MDKKQKVDLRTRKTEIKIHKHFKRLVTENGYDSLSIVMIANEAKLSRTTFYGHYASLDELYEYHTATFLEPFSFLLNEDTMFSNPEEISDEDRDAFISNLTESIKSVDSEKEFLIKMIEANNHQKFQKTCLELLLKSQQQEVESMVARKDKLMLPIELIISFVISIIVSTIYWWLTQPNDIDEETLAETLYELIMNLPFDKKK